MKTYNQWAAAASLATLLGLSGASIAEQSHGQEHSRMQQRMTAQLNLDEQQQALLGQISQGTQKKQLRELRGQLKVLVQADKYDSAAVDRLAQQIANITRSEIVQQSAARHTFYQSLSTEQRAQVAKFNDQKGKRSRDRRGS